MSDSPPPTWSALAVRLEDEQCESVGSDYIAFIFNATSVAKKLRNDADLFDEYTQSHVDMATTCNPCGLHELAALVPTSDFISTGFGFGAARGTGGSAMKLSMRRETFSTVVEYDDDGTRRLLVLPPHRGTLLREGRIELSIDTKGKRIDDELNQSAHEPRDFVREQDDYELFNRSVTRLARDLVSKCLWMGRERVQLDGEFQQELNISYYTVGFDTALAERQNWSDEMFKEVNLNTRARELPPLQPLSPRAARFLGLNPTKFLNFFQSAVSARLAEENNEYESNPQNWVLGRVNREVLDYALLWPAGDLNAYAETVNLNAMADNLNAWNRFSRDAVEPLGPDPRAELQRAVELRSIDRVAQKSVYAKHEFWYDARPIREGHGDFWHAIRATVEVRSAVVAMETKRRGQAENVPPGGAFADVLLNVSRLLDSADFLFEWVQIEGLAKLAHQLAQEIFHETSFLRAFFNGRQSFSVLEDEDARMSSQRELGRRIVKLYAILKKNYPQDDPFASLLQSNRIEVAQPRLDRWKKLYDLLQNDASKNILTQLETHEASTGREVDVADLPKYKYISLDVSTTLGDGYAIEANKDGDQPSVFATPTYTPALRQNMRRWENMRTGLNAPETAEYKIKYGSPSIVATTPHDHTKAAIRGAARLFCAPVPPVAPPNQSG